MTRGRTRWALTNRLLLLAVLIVAITTALLVLTTFTGVSQLASNAQSVREAALRDVLVAEIGGWLETSSDILSAAASEPGLTSTDPAVLSIALSDLTLDNYQYFEGAALIDSDGSVVAAWPEDVLQSGLLASAASASDFSSTPFVWEPPTPDGAPGSVWALASVTATDPAAPVMIARLRTQFVGQVVTDIAKLHGEHVAVVFGSDNRPIYAAGIDESLPSGEYEFTPERPGSATGTVQVGPDRALVGPYAVIDASQNLDWKVAVVESPRVIWRETWSAMRSGVLGWAVALLVALAVSVVVVRRVTRPLKELEVRARALAAGSTVETPAVVDRDEVGRLLEAFNSVAARLRRLNDIADLLASATDRSMVLAGVASSIAHMLPDVDVEVLLMDDHGRLELVAAEGSLSGLEGISFDSGQVPWIPMSLSTGQPTPVERGVGDDFFDVHGLDARYALAAPLRAGAAAIGAAVVVRHGAERFTNAECDTVRAFAAQASVALQISRLIDDERRSRQEAEGLRSVAERVSALGNIKGTLYDIGVQEAELMGFGRSLVVLRNPSAYGLLPSDEDSAESAWLAAWDGLVAAGAASDPIYVERMIADHDVVRALAESDAAGALMTPLYRDGILEGLIVLLADEGGAIPSSRQMKLAGTVGRQGSLALENAYLFQQAKSRADNLETIFRISYAVGSSLQSRVVLNRVLDVVQKILAADAVMLMTYDAQRRAITVPMARGILNREMLEAIFRPGEDVPGRVFETREPERYDHISSADTRLLNAAAEQGLKSLLAVPLLARGRSIGILAVFSMAEAAFTTDELDLLRTFASQAALAIDTAELFSREHDISQILQQSIRPTSLPHISGIEASSVYLPAGTDADIGGDYYDLFPTPDGRIVISIGDVCGKGAIAATKTSMIRYAIRGMVAAGLEPGRMLSELNTMLLEAGDPSNIVTLWLGMIDPDNGTLSYSNGGHPPALLLNPSDGRIERLATTGALLGAVADAEWTEQDVQLEPGAMILLYTDGVTEARSGVRFFGEGRVRRVLRSGGSAATVAQRLFAKVQRFAGGELRDDAAILAVEYAPPGDDPAGGRPGVTGMNSE